MNSRDLPFGTRVKQSHMYVLFPSPASQRKINLFYLLRMTNRNMKYGWKLNTRLFHNILHGFKLSDKIGPKTDPLFFMNCSNLSFKARIFVKRFK